MLHFQPLTPADRATIEHYTLRSSLQNCDYAFANMFCWREIYRSEWAVEAGFLLLRFHIDGGDEIGYMQPVGEGDFTPLLPLLEADAASLGEPLRLIGLSREGAERLRETAPERWLIRSNRDYYDYLYTQEALSQLVGKSYQPKRNHINRFTTLYPTHRYERLTARHATECLALERDWCRQREGCREGSLAAEVSAMECAFAHFDELGLEGGALYVEEQLVAFAYGSAVTADTFVVHAEKADTRYEGAFAMINRSLARQLDTRYRWINREEDLGVEGLRKAKLSYNPAALVEKYTARLLTAKELDCRQLWHAAFPTDSEAFIEEFLAEHYAAQRMLAIEVEGHAVAMLHLIPFVSEVGRIAYLYGIATDPAHRKKGYATQLIREALKRATEQGFVAAVLIPAEEALRNYYARLGFVGDQPIAFHSRNAFDFGTGERQHDRAMLWWCNGPEMLPGTLNAYYQETY